MSLIPPPYYPGGIVLGNSASANEYSTVDELLFQLPDNTNYLILPLNLRNAVYTLWNRTSITGWTFSNSNPTTVTVGGISSGTTFNSVLNPSDVFNQLLYPYVAASSSISGGGVREFGSSNAVTLSWSVFKRSNSITSINVAGTSVSPTGSNQSGTTAKTATQNVNTTFTISVGDGTSTTTNSTTVTWSNAIYWGIYSSFTTPPMTITSPSTQPAWATGGGFGTGKSITSTFKGNYDNINGNGNFLVFAWPTSYGTPNFKTNGMVNTAFTKVGNAISFTNAYSYVNTYDVWMSDYAYFSPIELFEIF